MSYKRSIGFLVWFQVVVLPRLMVSTGKIPQIITTNTKLHHVDSSLSTSRRTILPSLLSSSSRLVLGVWDSAGNKNNVSSLCLENDNTTTATTTTCSTNNLDFRTAIMETADENYRHQRLDASSSQHWYSQEHRSLLQDLFLGIGCLVLWNLIRRLNVSSTLWTAAAKTTKPLPQSEAATATATATAESSIPKILPFLYMASKKRNWKLTLVAVTMALLLSQQVLPVSFIDIQGISTVIQTAISYLSTSYMNCLEEYPLATKCITTAFMQVIGDIVAQWNEEETRRCQEEESEQQQQQAQKEIKKIHEVTTPSSTATLRRFAPSWYDKRRGISAFTDGLLISGPLMHICFERLEDWLPTSEEYGDDDEDGLISTLQQASSSWSLSSSSTTATSSSDSLTRFSIITDFVRRVLLSPASIAALTQVAINDIFLDAMFIAITFVATGIGEGYGKQLVSQFKADYFPAVWASWMVSLALVPFEFLLFRFLPLSLRTFGMNCIDIYWEALISFMVHRHRKKGHVAQVPVEKST